MRWMVLSPRTWRLCLQPTVRSAHSQRTRRTWSWISRAISRPERVGSQRLETDKLECEWRFSSDTIERLSRCLHGQNLHDYLFRSRRNSGFLLGQSRGSVLTSGDNPKKLGDGPRDSRRLYSPR